MKKYVFGIPVLIIMTMVLVILISIFSPRRDKKEQPEGDILLYYISTDGYSFHKVPYQFTGNSQGIEKAKEILFRLKNAPETLEGQPSIPQDIVWSDIYLENSNLIIDFTTEYSNLDSIKEIFLRASIVRTLTQIEEIQTVEFKVSGTPLMTLSSQPVGMMSKDYFIDGTEENWGVNQEEKTILYFADDTGTKLIKKEVAIQVVNNVPMEQLIIESIISTDEFHSPLPAGTTVLKTVTKDLICYVDLSKEFLDPLENISGEVTVYAIVNSLAERAGVSKVQFTVNGKPISGFRANIDFSQPIERNLDLIKQ
ncbi:MAG: hypothetical protein E7253_03815 [Lachnospiraceae bacterium]|nr:hypothetical protein [Lachnospiraceae bacterium]